MKNRNNLYVCMVVCFLWACSKSDNAAVASPADLSYDQDLQTKFFTAGNSVVPTINWNGNIGRYRLENSVQGISIDSNTGVISWDKTLPLGTYTFEVIAFNNAGTAEISLLIENTLVGKFRGDLFPAVKVQGDTNFILEFDFKEVGTLTGFNQHKNSKGDIIGPFEFFGSFTTDKNEVRGIFQYEEVADPIPFVGFIEKNGEKVIFSGRYFPDSSCNICTTFELELIEEQ